MAKRTRIDVTDESRSVWLTIVLLAWPVFVEQIFTTLVQMADTAMVGSLGKEATAAVTISNSPVFLLNGVIMSLGIGITALIARAVGEGNLQRVRQLMRHTFLAIVYIGMPICCLVLALSRAIPKWMGAEPEVLELATRYNFIVSLGRFFFIPSMVLNSAFRGYGDTKTPMVVNLLTNIINVILNFFLIYETRPVNILGLTVTMPGAGWGVQGAAAATAIGMVVGGLLAYYIAFRKSNEYRISLKDGGLKPDMAMTKMIFKISIPAMLERICMSSSGIFVTSTIATLGTVAVAANSLTLTAESMSYMPAFAFQMAITTLVGQALGARKPDLASKFVKVTMIMGVVVMAVATAALFVWAAPIIGFFTKDAEVIELAARCLRIVALIQIPQMAAWVLGGVFRGAGDTNSVFYITAGTNWGIRTLFSILAVRVFHMDLVATIWVMCIEILARLVLFFIRYRTGGWKTYMERKEAQAK